ncbi:unnamed protein product, partial [Brachionus calyciflorus]
CPIYTAPYRISENERHLLKKEKEKMLEAKKIRPSRSPWSSQVVVISHTEKWPMPESEDIFDRFRDSSWFTTLNLKSGYWQIEMNEVSIDKYEFFVHPFDLKDATIDFSRIMKIFNSSFGFKTTTRKLFMMGKIQHQVYGTGYHCLKKKHTLTTSMSFFGEKYESLRTEFVKVSRDECFLMVKNKARNDVPMDCDNEYCSYSSNPTPDFSWMSEKSNVSYSCATSPKLITANSPNDYLFNGKYSTIYHECPLYNMGQEVFTIQQDSDVLISNGKLALMANEPTNLCVLDLLGTTEGIYVSIKTNNDVSKTARGGANIEELKELLLAESDFKSVKYVEEKNVN